MDEYVSVEWQDLEVDEEVHLKSLRSGSKSPMTVKDLLRSITCLMDNGFISDSTPVIMRYDFDDGMKTYGNVSVKLHYE